MKITLCIDKQQRGNPSEELKQYSIDIGCPLRSVDEIFDELKINTNDNNSLEGKIIRRCYVDKYGVLKKLDKAETQTLEIPAIELFEGTNYVYILEYTNLNMKIEYLTNAEMNKYFATKMEMNSTIQQTYDSIMLSVSRKVNDDEIIAKINMSPEEIAILASKIRLEGYTTINKNFSIDEQGTASLKNGNIIIDGVNGRLIIQEGELRFDNGEYYTDFYNGQLMMGSTNSSINLAVGDDEYSTHLFVQNNIDSTAIYPTEIITPTLTQTSKEESKKNFELLENGLDIIKNTDIYKYHLKSQTDDEKKHIGFVIGDNFNYREEITSTNNEGVDLYSMVAVSYKAIKEQQQIIEELKKEIEVLKDGLRKN